MQDLKEFVFILLVIAFVIAGVQWLLLRFTHWVVALTATGFISFIIASVYMQLKNATPNGGSSGPGVGEFIVPTFVVFIILFCGFLLVCYFMQYKLPCIAYKLTFGSIAIFGLIRFGYQEIQGLTFYYELFSQCEIEVVDKAGGISTLQEIGFKNTSNGIVSHIDPHSKVPSESRMTRFANEIIFYSNSAETNRRITQEFSFDYSLCKEEQRKGTGLFFWIRPTGILPLRIVLLPDEKVDLYIGGNFIKQYCYSDSDAVGMD